MRITIKAKPFSREAKIEKVSETEFIVAIDAPAKEGKANARLIELLAEYFTIPKAQVTIVTGHTSRVKIVNIAL